MSVSLEILSKDVLIPCILMALIAVIGLLGNLLMIRAWVKYPKLRTDFYTVFTALAIVDIIFLVVSAPVLIMDLLDLYDFVSESYCNVTKYIMNVTEFISAYLIVVLSVLRGILLTNRNTISRPQAKHLIIVCTAFCIITALSSVPILSMYIEFHGICQMSMEVNEVRETWLLNVFASLVPLFLVFIIYVLTYMLGKRFFADSYSQREREKSRLVTSIIIAFIVCQIPYRVCPILEAEVASRGNIDYDFFAKLYEIKSYLRCWLMVDKIIRPVLCSKLAIDLSAAFDEVINCKVCRKSYVVSSTLKTRHLQNQHHNHNHQQFTATPTAMSSDNDIGGGAVGGAECSGYTSAASLVDSSSSSEGGRLVCDISPYTRSESTSSATSQTPLTRQDEMVDIEMS